MENAVENAKPGPGVVLTLAAVVFAVAAIQSLIKPFDTSPESGFMLFGYRTDGLLEAVVSRAHAVLMLALAYGTWRLKRYALPILTVYTAYIALNLFLYTLRYDWPTPGGAHPALAAALYSLVALGVPGGTAYLLSRRRSELS